MMSKLLLQLLAVAVLLGACATDGAEPTVASTSGTNAGGTVATASAKVATIPGGPVGLFASELMEFDTCDAFVDHVKSEALERVGPYGFAGSAPFFAETTDAMMESAAEPVDSDSGAFAPTAGVDYSTTNVQEAGVDEPDIVKTDGRRILALARGVLHYIDVSSGAPVLVSSLELSSAKDLNLWNHQLFMSGDTALLMASGYSDDRTQTTLVLQIDLTDSENLRVVRTLSVEGGFVSARLVGERASLVLSSAPRVSFEFVYPSTSSRSAELRAERVNRMVIEESTVEDWAPRYELKTGTSQASTEGVLIDCSSAYAPPEFSGFDLLSVLTLDLSEDIDVGEVTTVMSGGDTVYASSTSLYVATQRWIDWAMFDDEEALGEAEGTTTHIHRFDIGGSGGAAYEASGSVDGFLLSQFAMSEHDGYLRVASTDSPSWRWWRDGSTPESRVDVLEQDGRELRVVGSVGGLGEDEQIFAVRFMGDVGYVVTFRQTDPLYTIDLSDPANPTVEGELKILGYSAYLHPIGEGLLLGVGQDADEEGRISGTQVSIFDVSDLSNPVRTHQFTLPESSRSEVEFNHRAFLYWAPTGMAVLPVGWGGYEEGTDNWEYYSGAFVLGIRSNDIEDLGTIEHEPETDDPDSYSWGYDAIRRSLVIGQTLFTLSESGLKGSDLESLSERSWIQFPFEETSQSTIETGPPSGS